MKMPNQFSTFQYRTRYFWSKVKKGATPDACWEWQGHKDKHGYALFGARSPFKKGSRAAWIFTHGDLPNHLFVLHRCDNPGCVNPDHLFLGTPKDNMEDRNRKGRHAYGVRHGNAKLTDANVRSIRQMIGEGVTLREIASRFGVVHQTIGWIKSGQLWSHVR